MKIDSADISWLEENNDGTITLQLKESGKKLTFPTRGFELPDELGEFEAPDPIPTTKPKAKDLGPEPS